jgi:hypothetical protein
VTIQKAQNVLSFHPQNDVGSIIASLIENRSKFEDWDNPSYYNIEAFRRLEAGLNHTTWTMATASSD